MTTAPINASDHHAEVAHGTPWKEYFSFSTDHKVIGIQYLVTSFVFYLIGGVLAELVRTELATPASDFVPREVYNELFTMHATIMIFLWIIPSLTGGFGNFLVPLMIGAKDMAFPKLNAIAFWIIPPTSVLLLMSFFVGPASAGWTSYPPLSLITNKAGEAIWIAGVILLGTSSIMAGLNFLVTILKMRIPSMPMNKMPLFCWAMLATSALQLVATPVLTGAMVLLGFDLIIGTAFFNPTGGGDPIVYQHMFWFYSHPAVYIMILPAFGLISEILPVHARKPIFGYQAIAYSSIAISFLGLIVWAHHMVTSGTPDWLRMFFMIATMVIAVPTGIKVFSWVATVWGGKLRLCSAMLFGMAFVSMFVVGGLSGVMVAAVPFDIHVHDTYFIVAHLHYVLFGGSVFGIYSGLYHWFPKMTGRMLNEPLGKIHWALTFVGFNMTFLPMHVLGLQGMNRRVAEYDPQFATINMVCTIGSYILAVSTLPFIVNAVWSWIAGDRASDNPWEALTLEWTTPSPPPHENWDIEPVLVVGPYDYGMNHKLPVNIPLAKEAEPVLAAGPNSALRAEGNPDASPNENSEE
ncbi:MAG: cytochrome c oxidase subunit I [Cyanobacteria bacterium P01_A01_bin.17]